MKKLILLNILSLMILSSYSQGLSKDEKIIDSLQQVIVRLKIEKAEKEIRELMEQKEYLPEETKIPKVNDEKKYIESNTSVKFTQEQLKKFELRAMDMLQELMFQINIISYKKNSNEKKNAAISTSMNLFSSEDNTVEVRSVKDPLKPSYYRKIREYLNLLRVLNYSDIKFSAFEIEISENLTLGKDNKYYGVVSFCQKFEADFQVKIQEIYQVKKIEDITCKRIQIVVQKDEGFDGEIWRVFFGDISVDHYEM